MVLNYIGSKKSLLPLIEKIINKYCSFSKKENYTPVFGDLLAGTGVVGNHFSKNFKVISNDTEYFSFIINYSNLVSTYSDFIQLKINELNTLEPKVGLITKFYSPESINYTPYTRKYFNPDNSKKADAIREKIEEWYSNKDITYEDYIFLLASLIESIDKVANTTSVYGAFLKDFKRTALTPLHINPIHLKKEQNFNSQIYREDVFDISSHDIKYDLVYIDPPYNERQYSSNYHVLNYIAMYQENVEIYGKTGLIKDYFKSKLCRKDEVAQQLKTIVSNLNTKYVLISYNSEGLLSKDDISDITAPFGQLTIFSCFYKKYKSQKGQKDEIIQERMYLLDKSKKPIHILNSLKYKVIEKHINMY